MQIIDADGHVNDRPFDHIHFHFLEGGEKRSRTATVGPQEWVNFLDETGHRLDCGLSDGGIGGGADHRRGLGDCRLPRLQ